jgi:hypothetical protein
MDFAKILDAWIKNPLVIYIILPVALGYYAYESETNNKELLERVGVLQATASGLEATIEGLHIEQGKMHEILKLNVELAEARCE